MPYISMKVASSKSNENIANIARLVKDHTAEILLKKDYAGFVSLRRNL